jgi:hypothetical protein
MSDGRDRRIVLIAAVVSAIIAGLFGLLIKSVPEGFITHLPPYQGGTLTESAPIRICQVVRFWVPSKFEGNRDRESIINDLNLAVTNSFGGWTRWTVKGEWKNPNTAVTSREDGFLYEVGIKDCEDASVKKLHTLVGSYVLTEMRQKSMYFVATRFDQPK